MAKTRLPIMVEYPQGIPNSLLEKHILDFTEIPLGATVVVAASNSKNKEGAHYKCSGENDQEDIQNALNYMGQEGGTLLLLEGDYYISSPITIDPNIRNVKIVAHGAKFNAEMESGDIITIDYSGATATNARIAIEGIFFQGKYTENANWEIHSGAIYKVNNFKATHGFKPGAVVTRYPSNAMWWHDEVADLASVVEGTFYYDEANDVLYCHFKGSAAPTDFSIVRVIADINAIRVDAREVHVVGCDFWYLKKAIYNTNSETHYSTYEHNFFYNCEYGMQATANVHVAHQCRSYNCRYSADGIDIVDACVFHSSSDSASNEHNEIGVRTKGSVINSRFENYQGTNSFYLQPTGEEVKVIGGMVDASLIDTSTYTPIIVLTRTSTDETQSILLGRGGRIIELAGEIKLRNNPPGDWSPPLQFITSDANVGAKLAARATGSRHLIIQKPDNTEVMRLDETAFYFYHRVQINAPDFIVLQPQDLTTVAGTRGAIAYHDGSGGKTEGPAYHNGTNWISLVDGTTIA